MEVVSFTKLALIYVSYCHSLKSLISCSMARSLDQLQELHVMYCEMLEEIVTKEDNDITEGGKGEKHKILFSKLNTLKLLNLPNLECFCSGYFDYDIPLVDVNVEEDTEMNNNNDDKVQISFPQQQFLFLSLTDVPKLKCFCSGEYDYNIIDFLSTQECPDILTIPFKRGNVIVSTPNIHSVFCGSSGYLYTHGDLNLTIHYILCSQKYKDELRKLETFIGIEQNEALYGYIKRETVLSINKCHKLLNCVPSNMMHLFSHVIKLFVQECECLEEIFESSNDDRKVVKHEPLVSLPKWKHIPKTHPHILGLRTIDIKQCHKLKHVFRDFSMVISLPYLHTIDISHCDELKYVFSDVTMATSLPKLMSLTVCECKKMEEIIRSPSTIQEQQHVGKIMFPRLWGVHLTNLPSLKCFYRSSSLCCVELPWLSLVRIRDCQKMNTFWYKGTLYTPRLSSLEIEKSGINVTKWRKNLPYND